MFSHFEQIENAHKFVELAHPSYINKIGKNQEQFSQLDVANKR